MKALSRIHQIAADPKAYAKQWKKKHPGPVAGYLCSYFPEEVIDAAGGLAWRILAGTGTISLADLHLQSYTCSLVKGVLEKKMSGHLDLLDLIVFPHTCDAIQRLSDIWRINPTPAIHFDIGCPSVLNTDNSRRYFTESLKRFKTDLETHLSITIPNRAMNQSIKRQNLIRQGLKRLYELKELNPGLLKGEDLQSLQLAAFVADKTEFLDLLSQLSWELDQENREHKDTRLQPPKRIGLSGGICSIPDIHPAIESAGAEVVWDDLCTGLRYAETLTDETNDDPLNAIAQRSALRPVCPAKHTGTRSRGELLIHAVKQKRLDGIIFILLKFCDPHGFDYPYLKEMLDNEGIPSLLLEMEGGAPPDAALRTRIQAFIEMMERTP